MTFSSSARIAGNTISNNVRHGVLVERASQATVSDNTIDANGQHGIFVTENSVVNDIYRGRVVNLEPAIGAAFVDFGQGRNGFLHTSDVLSVYGDKDWSLDKLLTTSIDPDEWEINRD